MTLLDSSPGRSIPRQQSVRTDYLLMVSRNPSRGTANPDSPTADNLPSWDTASLLPISPSFYHMRYSHKRTVLLLGLLFLVVSLTGCDSQQETIPEVADVAFKLESVQGLEVTLSYAGPQVKADSFIVEVTRFLMDVTEKNKYPAFLTAYRNDRDVLVKWHEGENYRGLSCLGTLLHDYASKYGAHLGFQPTSEVRLEATASKAAVTSLGQVSTLLSSSCDFTCECGHCSGVGGNGCVMRMQCEDGYENCSSANPMMCGGGCVSND